MESFQETKISYWNSWIQAVDKTYKAGHIPHLHGLIFRSSAGLEIMVKTVGIMDATESRKKQKDIGRYNLCCHSTNIHF